MRAVSKGIRITDGAKRQCVGLEGNALLIFSGEELQPTFRLILCFATLQKWLSNIASDFSSVIWINLLFQIQQRNSYVMNTFLCKIPFEKVIKEINWNENQIRQAKSRACKTAFFMLSIYYKHKTPSFFLQVFFFNLFIQIQFWAMTLYSSEEDQAYSFAFDHQSPYYGTNFFEPPNDLDSDHPFAHIHIPRNYQLSNFCEESLIYNQRCAHPYEVCMSEQSVEQKFALNYPTQETKYCGQFSPVQLINQASFQKRVQKMQNLNLEKQQSINIGKNRRQNKKENDFINFNQKQFQQKSRAILNSDTKSLNFTNLLISQFLDQQREHPFWQIMNDIRSYRTVERKHDFMSNLSYDIFNILREAKELKVDEIMARVLQSNSNVEEEVNIKKRFYDILNAFFEVGLINKKQERNKMGKLMKKNRVYSLDPHCLQKQCLKTIHFNHFLRMLQAQLDYKRSQLKELKAFTSRLRKIKILVTQRKKQKESGKQSQHLIEGQFCAFQLQATSMKQVKNQFQLSSDKLSFKAQLKKKGSVLLKADIFARMFPSEQKKRGRKPKKMIE